MKKLIIMLSVAFVLLGAVSSYGYDFENGETLYSQNCARCHGASGEGGIGPSHIDCSICNSLELLYTEIDTEMPPNAPSSCTGECAEDTAAFIYEVLNDNSNCGDYNEDGVVDRNDVLQKNSDLREEFQNWLQNCFLPNFDY